MIEMRKNVTPGETPEKITVSMIDQDLKDGISKPEMAIKYGIKPWEVDEMFKHPFLKGRRPSRKKALSFIFEDDTDEALCKLSTEELYNQIDELPEVDPNQITLEDAIDDAIESAKEAKTEIEKAESAIVDMLSPTNETPEETLLKEAHLEEDPTWSTKNEDGEKIELDQESQNALNDAFNTHVNKDGKTLKETFDEELEEEDDETFEL